MVPQFALTFDSDTTRQLVRIGGAVTFGVNVARTNFAGPVSFTLVGLPGNAAAAFDPNPSNGNTRLLIKTPAGTPTGDFNLLVTGQAGGVTRTIVGVLQVRNAETLSVSAVAPAPVQAGKSVSSSVTVSIGNGDGAGATLSTEGLPNGVSASFRNNPTSGKTTMDISVPSNIAAGAYPFNVVARKGDVLARTLTTLLVNAPAPTIRFAVTPVTPVAGQGYGFIVNTTVPGLSLPRASSYSVPITITPSGGFASPVDIVLTGLLPGMTANFTAAGANQLTLNLVAPPTAGSTTLTVSATSGSIRQAIGINVSVY